MEFTAKLNRACELRRLTNQRELAEMARVSKSSLNRWLQGTSFPDVREASRLATVLEVPLDWLASDDDQGEPPTRDQLPEDEAAVLRFYRSLKRTGSLDEDAAVAGMASMARSTSITIPHHGSTNLGPPPGYEHGTGRVVADRDETEGHLRREQNARDEEIATSRRKVQEARATKGRASGKSGGDGQKGSEAK